MIRKMRKLPGRPRAGQAEMDAEATDRLVSAVLEGDSGQVPDPADGSVDTDALEIQSLIKAIRQVATSDSPLPESRVDTIMAGLQREAEDVPSSGVWRDRLGMVAGFLACTATLAAGLLLVGGPGLPGSPATGATATPALAVAIASVAALASLLLHRSSRVRAPVLPLLVIGALTTGSCAPGSPDNSSTVEIAPSAMTTFEQGDALWGVRDIIESGEVIWALTEAPPFLRAYDRSGRMLADLGTSGEGPGELRNPWTLSAATPAGSVIVWDHGSRSRSVFDAVGNFATSIPAPIASAGIRADIRSVTFGDPLRVAEDGTGLWVASYPGGVSLADDFWNGRILRITNGEAEPRPLVDFAADLRGAASRVPAMGLAPVPLWDGCPDGSVAVLDPVDRSLHLYAPNESDNRRIPLPWIGRPFSDEERLAYVRAMIRAETAGTDISDAEIEQASEGVLARAADQFPAEAPIGIDLRCSPGQVWIQEFDGSSHHLGYGGAWRVVSLNDRTPRFRTAIFPDGFIPYRITGSAAIGVVTDSVDLQRVAVAGLASLTASLGVR